MGEIGSVKNRFKTWFRSIKNNKDKLRKQVIYYVNRTVLFLMLPFLFVLNGLNGNKRNKVVQENKNKINCQKKLFVIEQELGLIKNQIQKNLNKDNIYQYKEVLQVKKDTIKEFEKKQSPIKKMQNKINILNIKVTDIESLFISYNNANELNRPNIDENNLNSKIDSKDEFKDNKSIKFKKDKVEKIKKNITKCEEINKADFKNTTVINNVKICGDENNKSFFRNYIIDTNNEVKELKNQITRIKGNITNQTNIKDLVKYKNELFIIKEKSSKLYDIYINILEKPDFSKFIANDEILNIDDNLVLKGKIFKELDKTCTDIIQKINIKLKIDIYNEEKVNTKKKEEREKNDIQNDKKDSLRDAILFNSIIKSNIEEDELELKRIKQQIKNLNTNVYQKRLLNGIQKLISKSLSTVFGIFHFSGFKNNRISNLIGAVIVNNTIRRINNFFYSEQKKIDYLNFKDISSAIHSEIDQISKTKYLYNDTLYRLSKLKHQMFRNYAYNDSVEKTLDSINNLEYSIINRMNELETLEDSINIEYNKSKQKIKRMEG